MVHEPSVGHTAGRTHACAPFTVHHTLPRVSYAGACSRCPWPRGASSSHARRSRARREITILDEVERTGGRRARSSRGARGRRWPRRLACGMWEWHALTGCGGSRVCGAACGSESAGSRRQHGRRAQGVQEWEQARACSWLTSTEASGVDHGAVRLVLGELRPNLALLPAACEFASVRAQAQRRLVCGSQVSACSVGISPQPKPQAWKTRFCTCGGPSGVTPPLTMLCAHIQQKRM